MCRDCIVATHDHNLFHQIEVWEEGDVELGVDMTRSDELGDLEGVGDGGEEHTSKRKGLGPKTKC